MLLRHLLPSVLLSAGASAADGIGPVNYCSWTVEVCLTLRKQMPNLLSNLQRKTSHLPAHTPYSFYVVVASLLVCAVSCVTINVFYTIILSIVLNRSCSTHAACE